MDIDKKETLRGFERGEFTDSNGVRCSIQQSSNAEENCIWLGPNDADPRTFFPHAGWFPTPLLELPEGGHHLFTTRMHLNREQAGVLADALRKFSDTGDL